MLVVRQLFELLVLALATSTISVTITKAGIFKPLRERIARLNDWAGELFSCPYCMAHWVAAGMVGVSQPVLISTGVYVLDVIISYFAVIAVAAVWSGLVIRAFIIVVPRR